jgi:hypothetical protein
MNVYRNPSNSQAYGEQVATKIGTTPHKRARPQSETNNYSLLFPASFALAHLAFANAESLALAAGLIFLLGF